MKIMIKEPAAPGFTVRFLSKKEAEEKPLFAQKGLFAGNYLEALFWPSLENGAALYVGLGEKRPGIRQVRETVIRAAERMLKAGIKEYALSMSPLIAAAGLTAIREAVEGIYMGSYRLVLPLETRVDEPAVCLTGIEESSLPAAREELKKGVSLAEARRWAMDMVNAPGNMLRPMDFAREIMARLEDTAVECKLIVSSQLNAMGMRALAGIGGSSENPPCMLVLRYRGGGEGEMVTGLLGKGVTCDTGGYCLKKADSMMGIKGDMAGGAAVAAAIRALAENEVAANVTGIIPMCENRIGPASLVPGDVITSYGGKRIEIRNTDAEGRLILADAMSYAVKDEQVDRVLDIATLTGAVVNMLGFSTAGALGNDEAFMERLLAAAKDGGERYWRLPVFEEQEQMLKSEVADIKNMGEQHCGTITAGLFIGAFAEDRPWVHLDIAGTAWVDRPLFSGQPLGATGAGVPTLYYLFEKRS